MNLWCFLYIAAVISDVVAEVVTKTDIVTIYLQPTIVTYTPHSFKVLTTTTTSPTGISYSGTKQFNSTFASIMLENHNIYRANHHSQPLQWNASLFEFAADYVETYDCSGKLKHSGGSYGKNLAIGYSPQGAMRAWYKEGETYDYNKHNEYNHFTAMVWNSTTQIGCAYKYCNSVWNDYIVCSYYPAGNVVGHNENNVFSI